MNQWTKAKRLEVAAKINVTQTATIHAKNAENAVENLVKNAATNVLINAAANNLQPN